MPEKFTQTPPAVVLPIGSPQSSVGTSGEPVSAAASSVVAASTLHTSHSRRAPEELYVLLNVLTLGSRGLKMRTNSPWLIVKTGYCCVIWRNYAATYEVIVPFGDVERITFCSDEALPAVMIQIKDSSRYINDEYNIIWLPQQATREDSREKKIICFLAPYTAVQLAAIFDAMQAMSSGIVVEQVTRQAFVAECAHVEYDVTTSAELPRPLTREGFGIHSIKVPQLPIPDNVEFIPL